MANNGHLHMLEQGNAKWKEWRHQNKVRPDLRNAMLHRAKLRGAYLSDVYLSGADLREADLKEAGLSRADLRESVLSRADLSGADLSGADLREADLRGAILSGADLSRADLSRANFFSADLSGADLNGANLSKANFSKANLFKADLSETILVGTYLRRAILTNCSIYGISVWDIHLEGAKQHDLVITPRGQTGISVDNLKIAQFIYLLLNNQEIRDAIDTIARKAVLILGRFTPERKTVLVALKDALRVKEYIPILFDFEGPDSQDLIDTVSTLANLSCFVIADLTDPGCSPYEVGRIAEHHCKPIQPLFQPSTEKPHEFAILRDLRQRHHWVLPTYYYNSLEDLLASLHEKVIVPSEQKVDEIARGRKAEKAKQ